jgi:type IV pilus assembly protein PilB
MIIEELAKRGILTEEQEKSLKSEIEVFGKREEEVILDKKILSEQELFSLKSEILRIPLREFDPKEIPPEVLKEIPEETADFYKIIPLSKRGKIFEIGMVYPEDLDAIEAIKFLARKKNLEIRIFLITISNFKRAIEEYRTKREEIERAIEELEKELKVEKREMPTVAELGRIVEEAPITKAVASILRYGIEGESSDIHIEPIKDKMRVRYRFLGKLYSSIFLSIKVHPAIVSRIKILSDLRIDETRIPQDGRFSIEYGGRKIDFRVSTFPTAMGEKVAIRILDPKVGLRKIEELGLFGRNFEVLQKAIKKPFGMILATGPTGSGKTTTLYAILQKLNNEGVNIVTLEDPVEYFIEGINQSQIRPEIGYTFATGLRHVLRQDPDIIMVGEIRDKETAELAVHAALTGHLVLSTLHTNNALGVIPRLIDLGISPFLIPFSLSIAMSQRLVRRLCDKCKREIKPTKEIKDLILAEIEKLPDEEKKKLKISQDFKIFEAKGCDECHFIGFSGRVGIFEVLGMTRNLEEIILKEPSEAKILEEAKRQGMITMRQDGILKVLKGITTIEEVLRETT